MKRLCCALLCALLILGALPVMSASAAKEVSEVMVVVKCNDYVSLREKPDKSSTRLLKVHLGELVTDCVAASNGFVQCSWGGKRGYILEDYLKTTSYTMSDGILPNQMVYNCNEYVSLREKPDTSSTRLIKVPKGAIVTSCVTYSGTFILCEYKGKKGYVLSKYLKDADYSKPQPTATPKVTVAPTPLPTYAPLSYYMQVVKCNEYVSLRKTASTSAATLKKVPLGAVVENCVQVSTNFVRCTFEGETGYILKNYLAEYEPPKSAFEDLDMPAYDLFMSRGELALNEKVNGYTVVVRRNAHDNTEEIMAVCYDANMKPCWSTWDNSTELTELTMTNAFIAGDKLIIFVSGKGFKAYSIGEWTTVVWELGETPEQHFGAGQCKFVMDDGSFFVIGYYSSTLYRISADGKVMWKGGSDNLDIYWPYYMEAGFEGLYVYYDSAATYGTAYRLMYDYNTGALLSTETVAAPVISYDADEVKE